MVSNLPRDLSEEVLSRIPLTGLRKVRSTCRKWNTLSKNRFFAKKHLAQVAEEAKEELMVVVMIDFSVCMMGVNLSDKESCIKRQSKLICPEIDVCQVFHCDGLLLCLSKDRTKLVVWNPYCGKPLWIEAPVGIDVGFSYALGYDKSSKSHKVLRFEPSKDFKIYDLNNNNNNPERVLDITPGWRVLEITPGWSVNYYQSGVTLNGNAYWLVTAAYSQESCLVCFDFTRETFGPLLPLPFEHILQDTVSLSVVKGGEKIAVLFQPWDTLKVEIWVTNKIEQPDAVTWESKVFLKVSLKQAIHPMFQFMVKGGTFCIDEERKLAIVFDKEDDDLDTHPTRNLAYIIGGVDGSSFKKVDLGESAHEHDPPLACSYLPSLIQPN